MEQSLIIYKASAGSGKTFALAVEYIVGLMLPHAENEFAHTLAVTFTNKATAEMKSRILETLYGLKMNLEETRPYLDAIRKRLEENGTPLTEEQVRRQADKALIAILHDYSHFRVETIDSFFQSILRGMARELGLAANLQVELSHEELIESAVDSLIETMDSKPDVRKWVMDYVREQLDNGDKWDIIRPLKAFAGNIFSEEYQQRSKEELERISDAETVNAFKRKMQAIRKSAEQDVQQAVDEVTREIENSPYGFDGISYGKNLRSFLMKARTMESDGASKTIQEQADGSKELLNSKYRNLNPEESPLEGVRRSLSQLLSLYADRRKEYLSATLALRHLDPLRLLVNIDERAHEIEGDAGRFTLSSTPALLSKMVEGSDAPFIYEKTSTYINTVMIDEFQDTSRMQWENFKKLLFEKLASGGKGLLVGDIKQSIYRWRGGDWKILYGIEDETELQRFHIQPKPLDINYRSHQTVVDFNNVFFPIAAEKLDAINPNARFKLSRIYEEVHQESKKSDGKGCVKIKLFKEADDYVQSTIVDMAEQIRGLQAGGLDISQIAILVRTNAMAQQLIEGFSQYAPDIHLVSDEAFLLESSVSVQMIVAAMRLLIDKQQTDGISEKFLMLHYLRDVLGKDDTTIQAIALQGAEQVLPKEFSAHRDELLQLPLYLLAERLLHIFSLNNIRGEEVYVLTFLDELQNHLRNAGAPDIQTFLTAWDDKLRLRAVSNYAVAGVRILTIHKSKGLEFHTVLLPFSHWQIESDRQGDILWCEPEASPYNELGPLPIPIYSKNVRTSVFATDYEKEHLERRVDALNTLYVAFTRAKANLYVWGKTKPADKIKNITTAADLIYLTLRNEENDKDEECFMYEMGTVPLYIPRLGEKEVSPSRGDLEGSANRLSIEHRMEDAINVKIVTRNPMLHFLQSNQAQDYLLKTIENEELRMKNEESKLQSGAEAYSNSSLFTLHSSLFGLSQREVGKRMHEVLSRIEDISKLDEVLDKARQEGIIGKGEEWDAITTRIKEGFRDPLVASWFKTGNRVYNECSIASIDNKTGLPSILRPDRVIMNNSCITVIDYKFGHPSRHYYDQVKDYMNLMQRMYPNYEITGYLWYVMGKGAVLVKS